MNDVQTAEGVHASSAPRHVPAFFDLLKEAIEFWKGNVGFFVLLCLSTLLLFIPLALSLMGFAVSSFIAFATESGGAALILPVFFGILGVCSIVFLLLGSVVAHIAWVHATFEGKSLTVWGAWKKAMDLRVFVNLFVGGILWVILFGLGFLLFIIPAIYLIIPFCLWMYVAVRENLGVVESMQRAFALSRGFWWTLAARLGWITVIMFLIEVVFRLFVLGLAFGGMAVSPALGVFLVGLGGFILALCSMFVFTPISAVFYRMAYQRVSQAKTHNEKASQPLTGSEKGQVVAIIIILLVCGMAIGILSESQQSVYSEGPWGNMPMMDVGPDGYGDDQLDSVPSLRRTY